MTIVQQGAINTTALIVPDLIVQIVPPSITLLNGVPTNILGQVGTAPWGPVNAPTIGGSMADYARQFGAIQNRLFDLGTAVAAAVLQGANNFRWVRVTDGTDVAASIAIGVAAQGTVTFTIQPTAAQVLVIGGSSISFVASGATGLQVNIGATLAVTLSNLMTLLQTSTDTNLVKAIYSLSGLVLTITAAAAGTAGNSITTTTTVAGATASGATLANGAATGGLTITSKYTGSGANGDQFSLAAGSKVGTTKATFARAGLVPEVFDNIAGSANALWIAIAAAINNGQSGLRGASQFIVATAGAGTGGPAYATSTLTSGTDGVSTITGSTMIGVDTTPRTGMYALRGTKTSVAMLTDLSDSTTFSNQVAFGLAEGIYMIGVGPAGDTINNAVSVKASAGIDSYAFKLLFGDWVYFLDTVNGLTRLISPQGYIAGLMSNLSPQNSTLNKQLQGVVGTQKSYQNLQYSGAELQVLGSAGIDVIANPVPGGSYFGARFGHNTSSNAVVHGDNYTRMTNYIASTLNAGMGLYVGRLQSVSGRREAAATLSTFFSNLDQQGLIGTADGGPSFSVQLDNNNNPASRVALGYMQADAKVVYLSIIEFFLINVEGGQSVQISRTSTNPVNQ